MSQTLSTISYVANVRFNYLGYFATPAAANAWGSEINISSDASNVFFSSSFTWARAFFPSGSASRYTGESGDVYLNLNSAANYLSTYEPGSAGWMVFLHELGHSLGLKHPHDNGGTGRPTFANFGLGGLDIDWATVMSYEDAFDFNLRVYDPFTPMVLDALALQYLYGKNLTTNAGDTVHNLQRLNAYATLWDASGMDKVSASTDPEGWLIALPDFQLSSLVDTKAGFAMPLADAGATPTTLYWLMGDLESADGSAAADVMVGNSLSNVLVGGGGDDFLQGGGGNDWLDGGVNTDTASFSGPRNAYTVNATTVSGTSSVTDARATDGVDTLTNVEYLQFGDGAVVAISDPGESKSGTPNADVLIGGNRDDVLSTVAGNDYVYARDGHDTLYGGDGVDVLLGEGGFDVLVGGNGQDYLYGGAGNDVMFGGSGGPESASDGVNVFLGGPGDDLMMGGGDVDYFYGEAGNNTAQGGGGVDILVGGDGNETYLGQAENDYAYAGAGNDWLVGGEGVDVLLGQSGDDVFDGGAGVDYLFMGAAGNDVVIVRADTGVQVVYEFEAGGTRDAIRLEGTPITSFAGVLERITDYWSFSVLTIDTDTLIWLIGIQPGNLTASDFAFA